MKIEIDGVPYVPATEASPKMEEIARALAGIFWGETGHMTLEETLDGLCVYVNDGGKGMPIKDALAEIAQSLK
jgi:hypothetical protein